MKWKSVSFGELYAEPSRNGVYKSKEHHGTGIKIVNMGELFAYDTIDGQDMKRLRMSDAEMQKSDLAERDLLFGRRSLVESGAGKCSIVEGLSEPTTFESSIIRVRVNQTRVRLRFLFYWLKSPIGRGRVRAIVTGTNVKGIRGSVLQTIEVACPPLQVQDDIVSVIRAYDDLIENNRRRIQLLEAAARLLYKEWFVHLRFPGHEHVKITNGVPEGWERKPLPEIAEFRLGKMLDQKKNRGDLMPYLANLNVRWGEFDFDNLREMRFEPHEIEKFGLRYGDIVMCEGGEPGRCAIWKEQVPGMMIQKAIHRIRPHEDVDYRFLYHSLYHKGKSGHLSGLFTGATIKHLPREKLAKVEIEIPSPKVMSLFLEHVDPIEKQIGVLQTGIRRASKARDLLLPRLMNGEIPV